MKAVKKQESEQMLVNVSAVAANAKEVARELDDMFAATSCRQLLMTGKICFTYHPEVASGHLGTAYKDGTEHWVKNGALAQMMDILDNKPRFARGSPWSVWLDADLTGGIGAQRRTKKCRLTPISDGNGGYKLMMDNTFDDKW